ncbi:Peroxidase 63 [Camellia lanceoleosa]|uniref:Peroxidase 63 n=1 Tax=Camellia lanceoleosa TaxID=1840588 RepID=A0ACC0GU69_9ERIC|nr:Peroxidase 63 [Camellia lanceoleosa]
MKFSISSITFFDNAQPFNNVSNFTPEFSLLGRPIQHSWLPGLSPPPPGVVSCANILAIAACDLLTMMGGPYYNVLLGCKDGLVSKSTLVEGNLSRPTMSMTQIINIFSSRGFSIEEMVALSGAYIIGFSHCKEFNTNIYNYTMNPSSMSDPSYNPRFADWLRQACADYHQNPTLLVFNNIMTPNKSDNMYYQNLPRGLGLLSL